MYVKIGTYGQGRLALHKNQTIRGGEDDRQKRAIHGAAASWISQTISGGRTTIMGKMRTTSPGKMIL
jgi:hypothetical protein